MFDLKDYNKNNISPCEISRVAIFPEVNEQILFELWEIILYHIKELHIKSICLCANTQLSDLLEAWQLYETLKSKALIHPYIKTNPNQIEESYQDTMKHNINTSNIKIFDKPDEDGIYNYIKNITIPPAIDYLIKIGFNFTGISTYYKKFQRYTMPAYLEVLT